MAKLKLRVPSLDALPKEQRDFYRQLEGGGFILDHEDDPDGFGIDNLAKIRGKIAEKERDYERLNTRVSGLRKADGSLYTSEEVQALLTQVADLSKSLETIKDKSKTDEQKLAEMVAQAKKPLETELAKFKAERESYRNRVVAAEKTQLVAKAKALLKPLPEWEDAIGAELERRLEIREAQDGALSHVILENGQPRMSSLMGRDGPMQIDEFVKGSDFRQKFAKYLQGDGKKGADLGAPQDRGGGRQGGAEGRDVHLSFDDAKDFKAYEAAKAQAAKQGGQVVLGAFPTTSDGAGPQ